MTNYGEQDPWMANLTARQNYDNTATTTGSDPAPYNSPIPGAAGYASIEAAANLAYKNALARLNQGRNSTLRQFGYTGHIDPKTGVLTGMAVDPNNPYGEYQQLRGQHATADKESQFQAESRGLGAGGGLAAQIQQDVHKGFGADDAAMGQALTGTLSDYQDQQDQAAYTRDQALWQAQQAAAAEAIANQNYDPADYTGVGDPGYGPPATAKRRPNSVIAAAKKIKVAKRSTVGQMTGTQGYGGGSKPKKRKKG